MAHSQEMWFSKQNTRTYVSNVMVYNISVKKTPKAKKKKKGKQEWCDHSNSKSNHSYLLCPSPLLFLSFLTFLQPFFLSFLSLLRLHNNYHIITL